ncbi:recombination regulator RecX [Sphaerisporangium sp. NPDC004334]
MPARDDEPGRLRPGDWGAWVEDEAAGKPARRRRRGGRGDQGDFPAGDSGAPLWAPDPPDGFPSHGGSGLHDRLSSHGGSGLHDGPSSHGASESEVFGGRPGGGSARGRDGSRRDRRSARWKGLDGPVEGSPAAEGPAADPQAVARAVCLRLLTLAPRTRAQLADALRKRDIPDEAAEAVLARFSDVGLIDDEAFAEAWVTSRHAGRGLARRALAAELRTRGVDEETVRDAVDQLDPDQELETARRLVARKLSGTRHLEPAARVRRLAGMLARKGYSGGLAYRVVREALESEGHPTDDLPDAFD